MRPEDRSLGEYLKDIEQIRETMLRAEDRLHVPPWFFYALGGLIGLGTAAHAVVRTLYAPPLTTELLAIWLPVTFVAGLVEVAAWIERGRRAGLPWLSRVFGKFLGTMSGIMIAIIAVSVAAIMSGHSTAGVILILASCLFFGYSAYTPTAAIWVGWALLAPGVGMLLADVSTPAMTIAAAGLIVIGFVVTGYAESKTREHG